PSRNRALDVRAPYAHAGRSMTQRSAGAKSDMHPPKFRAFCGRWPVSRKRGSEKGPNMICSPPMAIAPRSADELLRDVPVLRDLPSPDLHALAAGNEVRKTVKGAPLFSEGQPAEGLFIVRTGEVKLTKSGRDGREQIIYLARPGRPI